MRILKWGIVFLIAFTVAWVLIFTFTQEPFGVKVAVRLPGWKTQEFPVYSYVAAAFIGGLLIGVLIGIYNFVIYKIEIRKKSKRVRELEQRISQIESAAIVRDDNDSTKKNQHPEPVQ